VKFLVDNQLQAALARFLVSQGVEFQHVLDVGLADATDAEIWDYAGRNDCAVISKDEDFLYLAKGSGREGAIRLDSVRELPQGCAPAGD
jgi:predicted nuclease of predicted toxin-antitoxin system